MLIPSSGLWDSIPPCDQGNAERNVADIKQAIELYISEVAQGNFPGEAHIFN